MILDQRVDCIALTNKTIENVLPSFLLCLLIVGQQRKNDKMAMFNPKVRSKVLDTELSTNNRGLPRWVSFKVLEI